MAYAVTALYNEIDPYAAQWPGVAKMTAWPTPKAADAERGASLDHLDGKRSILGDVVLMAHWATPAAQEPGGTAEQAIARKQKARDAGATIGLSMTSLTHQAQSIPGPTSNGSPASTGGQGQLNPAFVLWLMGLPDEWLACAPGSSEHWEMPSSRKSRRPSSEP